MALLSRLFSSKKNNKPCSTSADKNERSSWKPFTFERDQVRILLFRECDWRGRKLLFDSTAVQKLPLENSCKLRFASRQKTEIKCKKESFVEVTNGYGYQYTKPSSDAKLVEEMMFGAVAMTFRGTTLKVHSMTTPNRLMCTKVFPSPVVTHTNRRTSDRSLEDSYGSSVTSMSEYYSHNSGSESLIASGPLDVPVGEIAVPKVPRYNSLEGDSGFCGDFSLQSVSSVGSPSYWTPVASPEARSSFGSLCGNKQSGGSLSSLQRRWIRNMSTSLELGLGHTDDISSCNPQHRRTKLGLAVVVTLSEERRREMEMFLFEHMSIIETMIERLRFTVEKAYLRKETFVHVMHEGWSDIQQSMCDMLCSQRLQCPIWLTLTSTENKSYSSLASMFLQDLCLLISTLDTKATNFFVSTLVTGILTHHLGWVNTVWSASSQATQTSENSVANGSLNELLRSHPYNPLWAQLSDLYGTLGSPTKIAKTIITTNGRKVDCVNKLLSCMTYFIRCGEVKERTNLKQDREVLTVLSENSLKSGSVRSQKAATSETSSKGRTKTNGFSDDKTNGTACDSQNGRDPPQIQVLSTNSSTFYVPLEDNSDLIRHQEVSSCTPSVDDPDLLKALRSESLRLTVCHVSKSIDTQGKRRDPNGFVNSAGLSAYDVHQSSERDGCAALEHTSHHPHRANLQSETIVQNIGVPLRSCSSKPISSCSSATEFFCPDLAKSHSLQIADAKTANPKTSQFKPVDSTSSLDSRFPEPGSSSFYVDDTPKHLSLKLDVLSQELKQFKEGEQFSAHALRSGNFASPSGAEWEHENYPTSPTSSGRASAECELTPDRLVDTFSASNTFPAGTVERGHDVQEVRDTASGLSPGRLQDSSYSVYDGMTSAFSRVDDVDQTQQCDSRLCMGPIIDNVHTFSHNERDVVSDARSATGIGNDYSSESQTDSEDLYNGSLCGLRSVKRMSRCSSQMSNLKDLSSDEACVTSSLYPDIDALAKMENVRLDSEPLCTESLDTLLSGGCGKNFSSELECRPVSDNGCLQKTDDHIHVPELITEKVSKLCRVPTMAVMFHLEEQKAKENMFQAMTGESFEMKLLNSERQMTSVKDSRSIQSSIHSSTQSINHLDVEKSNTESGVVFVLGDNEELKGLNKQSAAHGTSCSSNVTVSNLTGCESSSKTNRGITLKNDSECYQTDRERFSMIPDESKVVMVKSLSIELEHESGNLKTDVNHGNSACTEMSENELHVDAMSVIPRSFSVSLPVLKHKRSKKSAKILRRHTEKYCDRCKTILKLKCDKGSIPLETNRRRQQPFVSCEKCYCYLQNDANLDSLEGSDTDWVHLNRHSSKYVTRSHDRVDFCLSDKECRGDSGEELESSLEPETECMREDNAIFEQYDPSDEEILGPQTQTEQKIEVPREIRFGDLQIVDLPLPKCESCDCEVAGLASSLLGGVSARYVPDLVLQGCSSLPPGWEAGLRRDLTVVAKLPLLGHEVAEAVCIVANTNTWEVQLVSSHAYIVDKPGTFGVCVGMSQLVANMLESVVHLWRLKMPPEHCLLHLESKLRELYLRSQALAELLLTTEFCNMELLTTSLNLEANDVPLLLAIASTHSPQIAHRYGLSFG